MPVRNAGELIAMMKTASPAFQVGTPGIGTVNYRRRCCSPSRRAWDVQQIPYKGSNPLITDLAGGHVKVGFNPIPVLARRARRRLDPRWRELR